MKTNRNRFPTLRYEYSQENAKSGLAWLRTKDAYRKKAHAHGPVPGFWLTPSRVRQEGRGQVPHAWLPEHVVRQPRDAVCALPSSGNPAGPRPAPRQIGQITSPLLCFPSLGIRTTSAPHPHRTIFLCIINHRDECVYFFFWIVYVLHVKIWCTSIPSKMEK